MKRLTKFEIMRRNRRALRQLQQINDVEAQWARHEQQHQQWHEERYADTAEWLADARARILAVHRPQALRQHWWQFWKPKAKVAAPVIGHNNEEVTQWA